MEGQFVDDGEQLFAMRFENPESWLVLVELEQNVEDGLQLFDCLVLLLSERPGADNEFHSQKAIELVLGLV
jgi:hypothetical protein